MTIPKHHRGYMVLRHKWRPVACTIEAKLFMNMPKWKQKKWLEDWEVVVVCG